VHGGLDSCRYGVYWLLILRDQPVVGGLGLICPVAVSGHNYLALIRQGGLNPLTVWRLWTAQDGSDPLRAAPSRVRWLRIFSFKIIYRCRDIVMN
jgi:hypothetical protein